MKLNRRLLIACMHVLGWAIILLIPRYIMRQTWMHVNIFQEFTLWIPVLLVFYLNYYILIPRLLTNRRFALYGSSLVIMIVFFFFFIRILDHYYFEPRFFGVSTEGRLVRDSMMDARFNDRDLNFDSLAHQRHDSIRRHLRGGTFPAAPRFKDRGQIRMIRKEMDILVLLILSVAVSTSIRITGTWYSNEKERKEMENQKLTAELMLLKSQINPHFFFNTLNSIYSLAIQKSTKTPEAIVKLSEIMRYIIYEADKNLVPLKKELEYIRNYVELQRLRLMANVKVNYTIEGIYNDIMVEPLLFLPFIENAFKHGIDYTRDCEIKIKFVIASDLLLFTVENPLVQQSKKQPSDSSGIGLANTKKRLQLLYPDSHELKVTQTDDYFIVELSLNIRQHELHNS